MELCRRVSIFNFLACGTVILEASDRSLQLYSLNTLTGGSKYYMIDP